MLASQKTLYALRAVFELAKRRGQGPVKAEQIAAAQAIPQRFLEVILAQLKGSALVWSRRGSEGGYILARSPESLSVGEVIDLIQGPCGPIDCLAANPKGAMCPLHGDCAFMSMWQDVQQAINNVFTTTTFAVLVARQEQQRQQYVPSYAI